MSPAGPPRPRRRSPSGFPSWTRATFLNLLSAVSPGTAKSQLASHAVARKTTRVMPVGDQLVLSGPLSGRRVVMLGEIEDSEHLEELIAHSGGVVSHNISKNTSLVVLGAAHDPQRLEKAVAYGAEVVSPAELLAKLHAGDDLGEVGAGVDDSVTLQPAENRPVAAEPQPGPQPLAQSVAPRVLQPEPRAVATDAQPEPQMATVDEQPEHIRLWQTPAQHPRCSYLRQPGTLIRMVASSTGTGTAWRGGRTCRPMVRPIWIRSAELRGEDRSAGDLG